MSETKTLTVATREGNEYRRRVLWRVGVWVVHRSIGTDRHYTVTHEATKLAAVKFIPTLARARRAARALARIPGNWDVVAKKSLSRRQIAAAKRVIREYERRPA